MILAVALSDSVSTSLQTKLHHQHSSLNFSIKLEEWRALDSISTQPASLCIIHQDEPISIIYQRQWQNHHPLFHLALHQDIISALWKASRRNKTCDSHLFPRFRFIDLYKESWKDVYCEKLIQLSSCAYKMKIRRTCGSGNLRHNLFSTFIKRMWYCQANNLFL